MVWQAPRHQSRGSGWTYNLQLTLDRSLQYIAEKELMLVVGESDAIGGTLVMLEPASGRILALASWPDFNPTQPAAINRMSVVTEPFDVYELGSTFKPLLAGIP